MITATTYTSTSFAATGRWMWWVWSMWRVEWTRGTRWMWWRCVSIGGESMWHSRESRVAGTSPERLRVCVCACVRFSSLPRQVHHQPRDCLCRATSAILHSTVPFHSVLPHSYITSIHLIHQLDTWQSVSSIMSLFCCLDDVGHGATTSSPFQRMLSVRTFGPHYRC